MATRIVVQDRDEGLASPDPLGRPRLLKALPEDTRGAYTLAQSTRAPGLGAPPHVHAEHEEAFYVLDGELTFNVDEQALVATAGTFLMVPRGVEHAFDITGNADATYLCIFSPPLDDDERRSLDAQIEARNADGGKR
jgi:quercetin dioxygenase-like cupin family protein